MQQRLGRFLYHAGGKVMNKKTKAEIIRDNFLKMKGGKLISVEAYILAFVVLFILTIVKNISPFISLIVAFVIGFIFPVFIGTFKLLAWLAAVLFSLIWAFLAFVIVGAIANESVLAGLLAGVVFFIISFIVHKNYSGLLFQGISTKRVDQQISTSLDEPIYEAVKFCPKCGRRIRTIDGCCDTCDR